MKQLRSNTLSHLSASLICTSALVFSSFSHASPMGNIANYNRSCHAVVANLQQYVTDWGAAMASQGFQASVGDACIFNSYHQSIGWNADGTAKSAGTPNGVNFSVHAPGTVTRDFTTTASLDTSGNPVYQGTTNSQHQSEVRFVNQTVGTSNLLMPELRLFASSDTGERNSTNVNAWTGFERIAGTDSLALQLVIEFDYFNSDAGHSASVWNAPGVNGMTDNHFNLSFLASRNVIAPPPGGVFPEFVDIIERVSYSNPWDDILATYTAATPYTGSLVLDLGSLAVGDIVYVAASAQAFGLNGGFTDAFNTVTTRLQVAGVSETESDVILASQFAFADVPSANVSEPLTLGVLLLGLLGLGAQRRLL